MPTLPQPTSTSPQPQSERVSGELTPKLVKEVADKVYALLLADFKKERERTRFTRKNLKTKRSR